MGIIHDALHDYAASITPVFADRMSTVGASEIGQCARKIFWLKREDDAKYAVSRDVEYVDGWGARMRGTIFENHFWLPAMRAKFGDRLLWAGAEQETLEYGFISATPDALITKLTRKEQLMIGTAANCVLAECKTADPRTNLTGPKAEHRYQTIVQLGLVRATTKYQPTHAIISYVDASFWSDIKEFVVEYDDEVYQNARERAQQIQTSDDVKEMPPEGWIAGGNECRYCPFTGPCGIERRNLPYADEKVEVDPQFASEVLSMARELRDAEQNRDRDEARVRELQDDLKARLRDKGIRKVPGVVTWSAVKGRSGYDNKAIQAAAVAAGVDLKPFETQGEPGDRLTILIGPEA